MTDFLQKRLAELPVSPGVYFMKNAADEIIYIGKAKNLRSRVRSYFNNDAHKGHRAAMLLKPLVANIEWLITDTDTEALVVEATLIQKHKPRYNVRQKDDKHYPYIMVTTSEPFPRVMVVRKVRNDKNTYFGPFTDVRGMRRFIRNFPKWFKIRECNYKIPGCNLERPCLAYQIGRCDAPCVDYCTQQEYAVQVQQLLQFLEGKRKDLIPQMQQQMQQKAAELDFEEAGRIRDRIEGLRAVLEKQKVDWSDAGVSMDIIGLAQHDTQACGVVVMMREGLLMDRRYFPMDCSPESEYSEIVHSLIGFVYKQNTDIPDEIVLAQLPTDHQLLQEYLHTAKGKKVQLVVPQKGEKMKMLSLANRNAEMLLVEQTARAKSYSDIENSVFVLQRELGLSQTPHRIECFDISHLGGTLTVASMVSFYDGKPDKKEYRHFRIQSHDRNDDFASMYEVVLRRYSRLLKEHATLPNLILIDGGKGQVNAAKDALSTLGIGNHPIIGLAKREEEIILPGQKQSVLLNRRSPALKLLQHLRNEAHRFAITFQRESRKVHLQVDWLQIPGIGTESRKKIVQLFKSPQQVLQADRQVLYKLLGQSKTDLLINALQNDG
jgi:excinuclease ABC subunit C